MIGKINEIFASIQGEGIYFGEKQVFVRFSRCNMACSYCDTEHQSFREYEAQELLSKIGSFGRNFHSISFTGGEPLLQKDFLRDILAMVKKEGYRTYLETNGTLPEALKEVIENVDIIAMDIKLSSSGAAAQSYWQEHRDFLRAAKKKDVFIKSVISSLTTRDDFVRMSGLLNDEKYCGVLVLQPNSLEDRDGLEEKLRQFKEMGEEHPFSICIIPQMHKIIGVR